MFSRAQLWGGVCCYNSAGIEERGGRRVEEINIRRGTLPVVVVRWWWWGATNVMKGKLWRGFLGQEDTIYYIELYRITASQ